MACPERGVLQGGPGYGDVRAVGNVHQARALLVLVGAFGVPLPAQAEGLPVGTAVAVDGAGPRKGESVQAVGIDQGAEILADLTFDTGFDNRKIHDALASQQHCATGKVKMGALLEEERAALVYAFGYDDDSPTFFGSLVYYALDELGLEELGRTYGTVIPYVIKFSQLLWSFNGFVLEPFRYGGAIGPEEGLGDILLAGSARQYGADERCDEEDLLCHDVVVSLSSKIALSAG